MKHCSRNVVRTSGSRGDGGLFTEVGVYILDGNTVTVPSNYDRNTASLLFVCYTHIDRGVIVTQEEILSPHSGRRLLLALTLLMFPPVEPKAL